MARRIREQDVARCLARFGHSPSEFAGDDDPGFRADQHGPRLVHVVHDGPAEEQRLGDYTDDLRMSGYVVVPEQQENGRRRLAVTRH